MDYIKLALEGFSYCLEMFGEHFVSGFSGKRKKFIFLY